jgi:hypothetical protein
MINFNSFINENSTHPFDVNIDSIRDKIVKDAEKIWVDKLNELFLNKLIKFRGSKWSEKTHTWKDFVIVVKKISTSKAKNLQ